MWRATAIADFSMYPSCLDRSDQKDFNQSKKLFSLILCWSRFFWNPYLYQRFEFIDNLVFQFIKSFFIHLYRYASLVNCVPYMLKCLHALCAYVPTCLECLRSHVPTCRACSRDNLPACLAYFCAYML